MLSFRQTPKRSTDRDFCSFLNESSRSAGAEYAGIRLNRRCGYPLRILCSPNSASKESWNGADLDGDELVGESASVHYWDTDIRHLGRNENAVA
jgi:hypothetical protein